MAVADGGVEIEKVAAKTPERIFKEFIDPGARPRSRFRRRKLAFGSASRATQVGKAVKLMMALYQAFVATDASLVEINPLDRHRRPATCWRSTPR